jgi:hypothetical protein
MDLHPLLLASELEYLLDCRHLVVPHRGQAPAKIELKLTVASHESTNDSPTRGCFLNADRRTSMATSLR